MFRYDPAFKRIIYCLPRRRSKVLIDDEHRFNTIRIGKFKGTSDMRWANCFHLGCRSQRRVKCSWCTNSAYVPSKLRNVHRPPSRTTQSSINNKLGFLMENLIRAQSDSFYNNGRTASTAPSLGSSRASSHASIVTNSTYNPPTIVKAKEQILRLTSRFRPTAGLSTKVTGVSATCRIRPRMRRARYDDCLSFNDCLRRPASSPQLKRKRRAYRPPSRGSLTMSASDPLVTT